MVTYKSYVGDIGTRIRTDLNSNISGAQTITYKYKKPNGITGDWACQVESFTGGIVYYDVVSGDFDVSGQYKIQTLVEFDSDRFLSHTRDFIVYGEYD